MPESRLAAAFANALELARLVLAEIEIGPESGYSALSRTPGSTNIACRLPTMSESRYPMAPRKFSLAVRIVPSMPNSITACDLPIASACASASRAFAALRQKSLEIPFPSDGSVT